LRQQQLIRKISGGRVATEGCVEQDARYVKTKNSKTFTTWFFPVDGEVRGIVEEWVRYLRGEKLWGNDDPLFPSTKIALGANRQFGAAGLAQAHWSSASPIRAIFKEAFVNAGLPYFHPHSIRHTLARFGEERRQTPEAFKAWSQNLGHEKVMTTFSSYGAVSPHRQKEILNGLKEPGKAAKADANDIADAVVRKLLSGKTS
jgi:integrase